VSIGNDQANDYLPAFPRPRRTNAALTVNDSSKVGTTNHLRLFDFLLKPASESATATACRLLVTFWPLLDLSVPRLYSSITA